MSEMEELLDDILHHPDDDTRRLVYADKLEEGGDIERAVYIRYHCGFYGDGKPKTPLEVGAASLDWSPDLEWMPVLPHRTRNEGATWTEYHGNYRWMTMRCGWERGFANNLLVADPRELGLAIPLIMALHPIERVEVQSGEGWVFEIDAANEEEGYGWQIYSGGLADAWIDDLETSDATREEMIASLVKLISDIR